VADSGATRRRRLAVTLAVLLGLGVLAAAISTDVEARTRARDEDAAVRAANAHLATLRHAVTNTGADNTRTTNERDLLEASIASSLHQLASVNTSLSNANVHAFLQGANIATLQTCLGGVQNALTQIRAKNNDQAAQDISAVSGSCTQLAGDANAGLVYPFDFPDPDVILVGQTYYAYATNSVAGNIQMISSSDLVHWTAIGNALPTLPSWAAANLTWAPGVVALNGHFELYYAVDVAGTRDECISVATSAAPGGPFIDRSSAPLECQKSLGGSIDPSVFVAGDGTPYLVWKSGGPGSSTIWSQQLDPTGKSFVAGTKPTSLLTPDQTWESGTVEAPDLVTSGGHDYLFFSGNDWNSTNYAVGVATCTGPLGPCTDNAANPILASGNGVEGPGGESVFTDGSGDVLIAFHAWAPGAVGFPNSRELYIRHLSLSGSVPSMAAPLS
jgi:hypothetical protein